MEKDEIKKTARFHGEQASVIIAENLIEEDCQISWYLGRSLRFPSGNEFCIEP